VIFFRPKLYSGFFEFFRRVFYHRKNLRNQALIAFLFLNPIHIIHSFAINNNLNEEVKGFPLFFFLKKLNICMSFLQFEEADKLFF
jgi:hypothetical protein